MASSPKGRAVIEILLDSNQLNKQLKAVEDRFKRVGANIVRAGAGFTAFGAALIAPLVAATKSFVDFGDTVGKIATRTGASAEFISALGFAAEQSGADIQTLEKAIVGQQRTLNDMNQGLKTAIDSYAALGLTAKDFEGLNTEQSFTKIAQALSEVKDPSLRAATALEIFGKAGQKLIPLLNGGEAAIQSFIAEADKAGIIISAEDAAKAEVLADSLNRASKAFRGLKLKIGASLANQFTLIIDKLTEYIVKGQEFIDKNRGLVLSALQLGAGIAGIGVILTGLGLSAIVAGSAIGSLTSIVTAVAASLSLITGLPLGVLAASFVGASVAIGLVLANLDKIKAKFSEVSFVIKKDFNGAIEQGKKSIGLLKRAVATGDLSLAFEVLATSIELFFRQSFGSVLREWESVVATILLTLNTLRTQWKTWSATVAGYVIDFYLTLSKGADVVANVFNAPLTSLEALFIRIFARIKMLWLDVKGLIEAGIKILSDRDLSGAKEVLKEVLKAREEVKRQAEKKIAIAINLDPDFQESDFTKGLKLLKDGNQTALKDALDEGAKAEAKIISDLGEGLKTQDEKVAELIKKLEKLGFALIVAEKNLKKTSAEQGQQDGQNKDVANAIKSIAPRFGSLVETGSSAALKLFASNQNPMLKEQQKTNKTLQQIAENTNGLEVR